MFDDFLEDKYLLYLFLLDKNSSFQVGDFLKVYDEAVTYPDYFRKNKSEKVVEGKLILVEPDTEDITEEGNRMISEIHQFDSLINSWMAEEFGE